VAAGEELERGAVPRLGLIAVGEVAGRRQHDQLGASDLAVHHPHRPERWIAVAADQEDRTTNARQTVGDVVHREQRPQRVGVPDRRQAPVVSVELVFGARTRASRAATLGLDAIANSAIASMPCVNVTSIERARITMLSTDSGRPAAEDELVTSSELTRA